MSQIKKVYVHDTKPVTAGAVITVTIPSFATIDDIILKFTNNGAASTMAAIKAAIGKVAMNINGEQVINCNLSQIYDAFAFLGNQVQEDALTNTVSLNLGRLLMRLNSNKDFFAFGCANITTIQVQVYCNATVTGVTDVQFITERREIESRLGSYIKLVNYPQNMNTTGYSTVDTLPRDSNDAYLAVLTDNGGGAIESGECTRNGSNIIDEVAPEVMKYVSQARGFKNVTGYFNYLFADGSARGALPMNGVTDLRFKTKFSTAPTNGTYNMLAISVKNIPTEMLAAIG